MTVLDYLKYAQLATASYIRAGNLILGSQAYGKDFAELAASQSDGRLPLSIAQYLFDPTVNLYGSRTTWDVLSYYGGDNPATPDASGFAATLFQQGPGGEKVLAIRGTEPFTDLGVDLIGAKAIRVRPA